MGRSEMRCNVLVYSIHIRIIVIIITVSFVIVIAFAGEQRRANQKS